MLGDHSIDVHSEDHEPLSTQGLVKISLKALSATATGRPGQDLSLYQVREVPRYLLIYPVELTDRMAPISYRVTKDECLDLPPKIMTKRYVELTSQQRRLYTQLKDNFIVELKEGRVTATMALTRLLRLQQLICGYLPTDEGEEVVPVPGPNNRMRSMLDLADQLTGKTVIWCRFRKDIELLTAAFKKRFGNDRVRTYDGSTSIADRTEARTLFQDPKSYVEWLFANEQAGRFGVDLYAANTVIFYSNYFSWEMRIQAEDRSHRDGLKHPVTYIDMVAHDTVDEHILGTLVAREDMATNFMGNLARWLR